VSTITFYLHDCNNQLLLSCQSSCIEFVTTQVYPTNLLYPFDHEHHYSDFGSYNEIKFCDYTLLAIGTQNSSLLLHDKTTYSIVVNTKLFPIHRSTIIHSNY